MFAFHFVQILFTEYFTKLEFFVSFFEGEFSETSERCIVSLIIRLFGELDKDELNISDRAGWIEGNQEANRLANGVVQQGAMSIPSTRPSGLIRAILKRSSYRP